MTGSHPPKKERIHYTRYIPSFEAHGNPSQPGCAFVGHVSCTGTVQDTKRPLETEVSEARTPRFGEPLEPGGNLQLFPLNREEPQERRSQGVP